LGLFGKKTSRDDIIAQGIAAQAAEAEAAAAGEKKDESITTGNPKLDMELVKIKAQLDSFGEIRKANSERFSRIGEQMGELRGMVMDTNKTISKIEVSATKAIDLVESVQPEKLMIEIRKMDGKIESLRANIESNESMMRDLMEELKKMRQQMNFYKGIEQVAKLNEEVKGEILEIKKIEATIERHADKGETIFLDMEKKFAEYEKFQAKINDMEATFHSIQNDFDKLKFGISSKADKKEFLSMIDKFTEFEKHTGEILKLVDERNKQGKIELKDAVNKMKIIVAKKQGIPIAEFDRVTEGKGTRELPDVKLRQAEVGGEPSKDASKAAKTDEKETSGAAALPTGEAAAESKADEKLTDILKLRRTAEKEEKEKDKAQKEFFKEPGK
jgi:hypothetical protein